MIDSILQAGLAGIKDAEARASRAAESISGSFSAPESDSNDTVAAILDLKTSVLEHRAAGAVVRTADELARSAIDLLA